jgi:hypothetical protein
MKRRAVNIATHDPVVTRERVPVSNRHTTQLADLGVSLAQAPSEYRVNFHDGSPATNTRRTI